jgi:glycosyltransferase involved in cell wall biosynthesis
MPETKSLKVIQLLPELNEGGVERGVVELNREYVKRGITSYVVSNGGLLSEQIVLDGGKHIQYDVCSKNPLTAFWRIKGLRKIFQQIKPDILHARSRVPAWLAYLANRKCNYAFVTTVHGLNSVNKYSEIMTRGDRVITVGDPVRDRIVKGYNVPDSRIRVIPRGVDLDTFDPARVDKVFVDTFCNNHALKGKFVVTSVGRVTWLKDYETFISAIACLKDEIPEITGLIVGGVHKDKQEYLVKLQALVKEKGAEKHIIFAGSQTQMTEIYALSNLVVNASLKMGNVGRTVTEALALNRPVIATTYPGLQNLVEDGVNGYIVVTKDVDDLAAKIKLAYENEFKNIRAGLNYEYTLTAMVDRTIEVYRELIS